MKINSYFRIRDQYSVISYAQYIYLFQKVLPLYLEVNETLLFYRFSAANLQKKEGKSKKAGQTLKKLQSLYEMSLPMSLAFYASGY